MVSVREALDVIQKESPASVPDAGAALLGALSDGQINATQFLSDPQILSQQPQQASRYLAQVTLKALRGEYETVDEIAASLRLLEDREPPLLEPNRKKAAGPERVVIPEARVVEVEIGEAESRIDALVTSGALKGEEIRIRLSARSNPTTHALASRLWVHAAIAAYNLVPGEAPLALETCPETFIVIEPLRQINVTSIARSLRCAKPQIDQIRRGRGDVTVQTLKGIFVHALFDKMLEGASDLEALYDAELPRTLVPLASVTDAFFNEAAFRVDVLRHAAALQKFIDAEPHLRDHAQLELKRYSATLGIQGRIDALFHEGSHLDILELKTGAQIRTEDHAQLFIYRLLVSDFIRRQDRNGGAETRITARLLSSTDGGFTPLKIQTDFHHVLDARNTLVAAHYALGSTAPHFPFRYEGFDKAFCGGCVSWTRTRCAELSTAFGDRPTSEESPALSYFRRFTELVERERWTAEADVAQLLDDSAIEARVKRFHAIRGARIVPDAEAFTFEFEENTSDIESGDGILVHSGNISSSHAFHGYVRAVESRRIRIFIPVKNLTSALFEGRSWNLDRVPADVTAEAAHTALYDFLVSPDDAKKRAILGVEEVRQRKTPPAPSAFAGLNSSQAEAVHRARTAEPFHLIWGPPGTGKTKVIPGILEGAEGPILLGAFTNTAVDKMLFSLLERDPATQFLRMGRKKDSPELAARLSALQVDPADFFSEDMAEKQRSVAAVRRVLDNARIVAATAHRASTLPYLRRRAFDIAVVDEAGQITEPLTLGLILRARRFVLIGDDRQLPPVVRAKGLAFSMFERLKREHPSAVTLLDTQYRMHPGIMAVANRMFYEGKLRTGVTPDERMPPEGGPVSVIPVETGRESADGERRNLAEAEVARGLVLRYIEGHGIPGSHIGVVSPFRAQAALVRRLLDEAGVTGVTVDTVERFQGGERDVMILSFVRSSASGFVFDERRFNVAITRARRKLVLVAHPDLFRGSRYEWLYSYAETPML